VDGPESGSRTRLASVRASLCFDAERRLGYGFGYLFRTVIVSDAAAGKF
jgi:hypothetical protein